LGEALRTLDPRRLGGRAEDGNARVAQDVREPCEERRLGTDDYEVDVELTGEGEQPLAVLGANGVALADPCDPGVAGRGVDRIEPRTLRELPDQRVLTPARPDDEDLHAASLLATPARLTRRNPEPLGPVVRFARPPPRGDRNRERHTCLQRGCADCVTTSG